MISCTFQQERNVDRNNSYGRLCLSDLLFQVRKGSLPAKNLSGHIPLLPKNVTLLLGGNLLVSANLKNLILNFVSKQIMLVLFWEEVGQGFS